MNKGTIIRAVGMQHANRVDFYVNMAFKLRFLCSAKLPKLYKNIENITYILTEMKRGKGRMKF